MHVKTVLGYTFEVDDPDVKVGQRIELPIPEPEKHTSAPDRVLNFMAQMYGRQKEWNQKKMKKFVAPEGLKRFPEYILGLPPERLRNFLTKFCAVNARLNAHYSKTSGAYTPEVWMKCRHETLARELQYLWQRMGIRTRVTYRKQLGYWLVLNSGSASYLQIRELLVRSRNPALLARVKQTDVHVPLKFKLMEVDFTDKVAEISETPFDNPVVEPS